MTNTFKIIAASVLVFVFVPNGLGADDRPAARAKYAELAAKVRAGNQEIDWQALRVAAAIGEVGNPSEDFQAIQGGYSAMEQGKFEDALKAARGVEDHNIADVDAHYLAWRSLTELGREGEADKERLLVAAILNSITSSGDGKSAKKPHGSRQQFAKNIYIWGQY
jgi:hypothetical protein